MLVVADASPLIALAVELRADLLVVDDRGGRRVAAQLAVPLSGTVGVLVKAKFRGAIPAVRPILDRLIAAGFRVGRTVYDDALRAARE